MTSPSVRLLGAAVWGLLDGHAHLVAFDSIVTTPPTDGSGNLTSGYAVFYPGGGDPALADRDRGSLSAKPGQLLWSFQISAVGQDRNQITWVIDEVRTLLDGKTLTVAGAKVGRMQPPFGYQPPPPRPEYQAQPPRLLVPLQYQVLAVTA